MDAVLDFTNYLNTNYLNKLKACFSHKLVVIENRISTKIVSLKTSEDKIKFKTVVTAVM